MASIYTRFSRKSEALTTRSSTRGNVAVPPSTNSDAHNRQLRQPNIGRKKRPHDAIEEDEDLLTSKKAKFTVEIRTTTQHITKTQSIVPKDSPRSASVPAQTASPPPSEPQETEIQSQPPHLAQEPPIHRQKFANGIRHELDRLGPSATDLKDEKRKLRSQECTTFKSELSAYFPEYDEVIGNEPRENHILSVDTPIIIIDSAKTSSKQRPSPRKPQALKVKPLKEFPSLLLENLHNAEKLDFSHMFPNYKEEGGVDPLGPEYFEALHRKPERQEKAIRNSDKGRAQHEKDQVLRLLEGLQGQEWLKLMGVNGITDSRKKEYEPARDHFIRGCEAILEKFRTWKEEEKRRKLEREQALADAEREDDEMSLDDDVQSNGDPPDYSDIDASAAKQLHEEAVARSGPPRQRDRKRKQSEPIVYHEREPEKEFKSFFAKPYLRAAALGKQRRSHRSVSAWGQPLPDFPEQDFDLPEEYRDEETLRTHARRKRRDRRVNKTT